MTIIAVPESIWANAQAHLFGGEGERFGFFLAGIAKPAEGLRFCVKEFVPIRDEDLETDVEIPRDIKLDVLLGVINRAKRTASALIENHNHFGSSGKPAFSSIDHEGLKEFSTYVINSLDSRPYAALVWDLKGVDGLYWEKPGSPRVVSRVVVSGGNQSVILPTSARTRRLGPRPVDDRAQRQILLLGNEGQARIGASRVAIVGLGGTGSHVAQQLAYLGVRDLVLIDPDVVERSNLNRLIGAKSADIGRPKVQVVGRVLERIAGKKELRVSPLQCDVRDSRAFDVVASSDLVFGCVDNDGARLVLNELSRALVLPYIDSSCGIQAKGGSLEEAGGRVAIVQPDGPCLDCMTEIDRAEANYFLSSPEKQAQDRKLGYVTGWDVRAPSVVSFNGVVASAAVSEFLLYVTALRPPAPLVYYYVRSPDAASQRMVQRKVGKIPQCYSCSLAGLGDALGFDRYSNWSTVIRR